MLIKLVVNSTVLNFVKNNKKSPKPSLVKKNCNSFSG